MPSDDTLLLLGQLRGTLDRVEALLERHTTILIGDGTTQLGLAARVKGVEDRVAAVEERLRGGGAAGDDGAKAVITRSDARVAVAIVKRLWPVLALLGAGGGGAVVIQRLLGG